MLSVMSILILLLLLQVKHCYADFVLQTYMQTVKKGVWLHPIGISHTVEHMYCSALVILAFSLFYPLDPLLIIPLIIGEGIVHYVVDFTKVKYGSKDNTKPIFWTQFGLDQLAHQVTYLAMVFYIFQNC